LLQRVGWHRRAAEEEGTRLNLAVAQNAENLPAAKERRGGGKIGQVGQREQQRHDALQHIAVPVRFSFPASHSVPRFGRGKYRSGFGGCGKIAARKVDRRLEQAEKAGQFF
jgi:hypothetical protein